jgi:hypothetical protein
MTRAAGGHDGSRQVCGLSALNGAGISFAGALTLPHFITEVAGSVC